MVRLLFKKSFNLKQQETMMPKDFYSKLAQYVKELEEPIVVVTTEDEDYFDYCMEYSV